MALSDEQIRLMAFNDDPGDWNNLAFRDCWVNGYKTGARAIEAEVRKQDNELILMLVERIERADKISGYPNNKAAIAAAHARLESKP